MTSKNKRPKIEITTGGKMRLSMGARKEITEKRHARKTVLLDEFTKRTGYDRKYTVKLLKRRFPALALQSYRSSAL
jgi:hypothetical protein